MRKYEYIEHIIKNYFDNKDFTLSDIRIFIRDEKRKDFDVSYLSKLFKQLLDKNILKLVSIEDNGNTLFPKKYYRLVDKNKWDKVFL